MSTPNECCLFAIPILDEIQLLWWSQKGWQADGQTQQDNKTISSHYHTRLWEVHWGKEHLASNVSTLHSLSLRLLIISERTAVKRCYSSRSILNTKRCKTYRHQHSWASHSMWYTTCHGVAYTEGCSMSVCVSASFKYNKKSVCVFYSLPLQYTPAESVLTLRVQLTRQRLLWDKMVRLWDVELQSVNSSPLMSLCSSIMTATRPQKETGCQWQRRKWCSSWEVCSAEKNAASRGTFTRDKRIYVCKQYAVHPCVLCCCCFTCQKKEACFRVHHMMEACFTLKVMLNSRTFFEYQTLSPAGVDRWL